MRIFLATGWKGPSPPIWACLSPAVPCTSDVRRWEARPECILILHESPWVKSLMGRLGEVMSRNQNMRYNRPRKDTRPESLAEWERRAFTIGKSDTNDITDNLKPNPDEAQEDTEPDLDAWVGSEQSENELALQSADTDEHDEGEAEGDIDGPSVSVSVEADREGIIVIPEMVDRTSFLCNAEKREDQFRWRHF